jgi:hypothetical protein
MPPDLANPRVFRSLYQERIEFFRHNPYPPDWDGTAEALAK